MLRSNQAVLALQVVALYIQLTQALSICIVIIPAVYIDYLHLISYKCGGSQNPHLSIRLSLLHIMHKEPLISHGLSAALD